MNARARVQQFKVLGSCRIMVSTGQAERPRVAVPSEAFADRTVLSPGTQVCAQISGEDIRLEGSFRGEALGRYIRVETSADVEGSLVSEVADILGHFQGTIDAEVLRFGSCAVARGTFRALRLALAEGATVEGAFNLSITAATSTPIAADASSPEAQGDARSRCEPMTTSAARAVEHTIA